MGQAVLMMFWAPCDSRLIPDQLLMVLIVNKQVTASRSEFCWEMDEQLSAPASQRPVLNHLSTLPHSPTYHHHTHKQAQVEGLTWVAVTRTCHHLLHFSFSQRICQPLSPCVCVCVWQRPYVMCLPILNTQQYNNHNTLTTHCLCTYISRILSAPLLPDSQGYVCVVLLRTIPWPTRWDEMQKVELKWLSYCSRE